MNNDQFMVNDIFLFEFFDVQSMENVCHEYHKFFGHSFKKMQNMGTCLVASVQIIIFFDFMLLF